MPYTRLFGTYYHEFGIIVIIIIIIIIIIVLYYQENNIFLTKISSRLRLPRLHIA